MRNRAAISVFLIFSCWFAGQAHPQSPTLTEAQRVTHLLNRIGFGPRPGDVERVREIGIEKYIEIQLHPESIDDALTDARLTFFESLAMDIPELFQRYPDQQMLLRQLGLQPGQANAADAQAMRQKLQEYSQENGLQQPQRLLQELIGQKVVRAVYSERQLQEVMTDFWYNHFNIDWSKGQDRWLTTDFEINALRPNALGKFKDLLMATARSPAMMFYLDNHVSWVLDPRLAPLRPQIPPDRKPGINENYARELMELHTLGVDGGFTQKDVQEVARAFTGWTIMNPQPIPGQIANPPNTPPGDAGRGNSPQGLAPEEVARRIVQAIGPAAGGKPLNVDAIRRIAQAIAVAGLPGLSQNPETIVRVAQALGIPLVEPVSVGEFLFRPGMHDMGEKVILGRTLKADRGIEDGEEVIDIIAHHPSTARFIATKLVRRFVADDAPQSLIDRVAATFLKTDGDIREMLRVILTSDEFFAPAAWQAKTKSPFELAVSAIRFLQGTTDGGQQLARLINEMGQPLYQYPPPTGFPDESGQWMSNGALLQRINFGIALTANRIPGTRVSPGAFNNDANAAALHLGSPEFQKR